MNDDLISRSALLANIEESVVFSVKAGQPSAEIRGANKITSRIKAAPAVDAEKVFEQMGLVKEAFEMAKADLVPVVRCKDCKYIRPEVEAYTHEVVGSWCSLLDLGSVEENHFCSYGERSADDADCV